MDAKVPLGSHAKEHQPFPFEAILDELKNADLNSISTKWGDGRIVTVDLANSQTWIVSIVDKLLIPLLVEQDTTPTKMDWVEPLNLHSHVAIESCLPRLTHGLLKLFPPNRAMWAPQTPFYSPPILAESSDSRAYRPISAFPAGYHIHPRMANPVTTLILGWIGHSLWLTWSCSPANMEKWTKQPHAHRGLPWCLNYLDGLQVLLLTPQMQFSLLPGIIYAIISLTPSVHSGFPFISISKYVTSQLLMYKMIDRLRLELVEVGKETVKSVIISAEIFRLATFQEKYFNPLRDSISSHQHLQLEVEFDAQMVQYREEYNQLIADRDEKVEMEKGRNSQRDMDTSD